MRMLRKIIILFCLFFLSIFAIYVNKSNANETNKIIENGVYEIETNLGTSKVLDISAGSIENGANVQIWGRCNVFQQRFKITYLNDGYYSIKSVKSGKMLDVAGAGKEKGTNVWQYEENGTDAQKWKFEKTEDGKYIIVSKCNDLALTLASKSPQDGTNIEVNENLNGENQKFKLRKIEEIKSEKTIENGVYTIFTALDQNKVLDVSEASKKDGANIQIWDNVNVPQQKFYVSFEKGYYTIKNVNSGKMMDVAGANTATYANVWQYEGNGTDAQKWIIKQTEDGYYSIISKLSGINVEVSNSKTLNGTNVQMNFENNELNQKFIFSKAYEGTKGIIENGIYEITTKLASNMLLDISEGSTKEGANVQIWADANEKQQKFEFVYIGDGLYKILSVKSGKALTVSTTNSSFANVYQSTYNGSLAQAWKLEKLKNGYYNIISKYNSKVLDVYCGGTSNGTNINTYIPNGTNAQQFMLEQKFYGIDVSHWQNTIDFKLLKESGKVDFIIIRAGQGTTIKDREFERNYLETKKYNIPTGVYLYAKARNTDEVKMEANNLLQMLKGKNFELPIFYDIEEHEDLDNETITKMYIEFYNIIKKAGYTPGLYASKYYLLYKIDTTQIPKDSSIWVASYGPNNGAIPNDVYKYYGDFDIWQYTSTGHVPGIVGEVDCNVKF